jgi:Circularly permutated YpsA SLOG family
VPPWHRSHRSGGSQARQRKPFLLVFQGMSRPSEVCEWVEANGVKVLNVAGNRESKAPKIGARVERFLRRVFRRLGHEEAES